MLSVTVLIRMVADGFGDLAWLLWVTPFGLVGEVAPYAANRIGPLILLVCIAVVLAVAARFAADRRDTGEPATPAGLLGSSGRFACRTAIRPSSAGVTALAVYFLVIGLLAVSATAFLADNPRFADLAARAGFAGSMR